MHLLADDPDGWTLSADDRAFVAEYDQTAWLRIAFELLSYRKFAEFVAHEGCEPAIVLHVIAQLHVADHLARFETVSARTTRRRRREIREHLGVTTITREQEDELRADIEADPMSATMSLDALVERCRTWTTARATTLPGRKWIERVHTALQGRVDEALFREIHDTLPESSRKRLLDSIVDRGGDPGLKSIRDGAGRAGKPTFDLIASHLRFMQEIGIQDLNLDATPKTWREDIALRISRMEPNRLARASQVRQVGQYSVYLFERMPLVVDTLIEALVKAVDKFRKAAENRVDRRDRRVKRDVYDDRRDLHALIHAILENPERPGIHVLQEVLGEDRAREIVARPRPSHYEDQLFAEMKKAWTARYRGMLHTVLELLEFHTRMGASRPLVDALDWVNLNWDRKSKIWLDRERVPLDGVLPSDWAKGVVRADRTLDKHAYELSVVRTLGERIGEKSVWTPTSGKYGDPEHDLPVDFEENRERYYAMLGRTLEARRFVDELRAELVEQLVALDDELPDNPHVSVSGHIDAASLVRARGRGHGSEQNGADGRNRMPDLRRRPRFLVARLERQAEPPNLVALKREVFQRWDRTDLLSVLKEAALDTGFLRLFTTVGRYHNIPRAMLDTRLLFCLFGLGTNIGVSRIAGATGQATERELEYVRRYFVTSGHLRAANAKVVNAILDVRNPDIWGPVGTACASDSQQFGAWDANPLAERHVRYGGTGIMAYSHVERRSACIYSRTKSVSSPEYATMIEGILRHDTDMDVERVNTDSHGQTEVAFAFCRMLGVDLAPRIKRIAHTKLFVPDRATKDRLTNLRGVVAPRYLDFGELERHYDTIVHYAAAMKARTSDPETILRRFKRKGTKHPVHDAIQVLGRAVKTIFVCRYLRFEGFRREIQEGLNVMENWHSATRFVGYGRAGEISTNRDEDQEVHVQALHLLQNCMVYVNTRMFQSVLADESWMARMAPEDLRGITPLVYAHINPYGEFALSLEDRLNI